VELQFSEDIYVMQTALKLSKLYLETAMDYSVYQAMFDTGKDLPSNADVLKEMLASKISMNMKKYTMQGYDFIDKTINLPTYEEGMIKIEKMSDGELNISALGGGNIYYEEIKTGQMENELIRLELSSYLEKIYDFRFFSLYEKAVDISKEVKSCQDSKRTDGSYGIVLDANQTVKPCSVKVTVTDTSKKFPLYNGTDVSFEPISFEFLVKVA
jgi:hypothetical protein